MIANVAWNQILLVLFLSSSVKFSLIVIMTEFWVEIDRYSRVSFQFSESDIVPEHTVQS